MSKQEQQFVNTVWQYYREQGRHELPWRQKSHLKPYTILVSEMMLQQTQVARVVPKYRAFVKRWPTAQRLATASLAEVLTAWQGLGYNRRAKYLHQCVNRIIYDKNGRWPKTARGLEQLPGVGSYTAAALVAFAYNQPVTLIETNIRTVYLHHFFHDKTDVSDTELLPLIASTCDQSNSREWYWALMDYGAYLKETVGNLNQKSKQYTKQSRFKGSDREIRGAIIRELSQQPLTQGRLEQVLKNFESVRIRQQLEALKAETLIEKCGRTYVLAGTSS